MTTKFLRSPTTLSGTDEGAGYLCTAAVTRFGNICLRAPINSEFKTGCIAKVSDAGLDEVKAILFGQTDVVDATHIRQDLFDLMPTRFDQSSVVDEAVLCSYFRSICPTPDTFIPLDREYEDLYHEA